MKKAIVNGSLLTPFRQIRNGGLLISEGKILELFEETPSVQADFIIDAKGAYVSPGFIDIHTHGGCGYEYLDGKPESVERAAKFHMRHGTTTIVPTLSACSDDALFKALDAFKKAKSTMVKGPELPGVHLEGPYLSHEQKGAQNPHYLRLPLPEHYLKILNYSDDIVLWTSSPELPGALELADELSQRGILCAIGHSDATYQQIIPAFERGFTHITHFYSGCSLMRRIDAYRHMGVVDSGYVIDNMTVDIIADGHHLPAELLKMIVKLKPPDKICLVTDSLACTGASDKSMQRSGGMDVLIEDGVAKLPDRSSFAGSIATSNCLVRNMRNLADVPLIDAVRMMTYNPANIMGIQNRKGCLSPGKDADICVFDDDLNIKTVLVGGETTFEATAD